MTFFIVVFLCSVLIPFLFIKSRIKLLKWTPSIVLFGVALVFVLKASFFPTPGMAALGEIVYIMMFGISALGAMVGAVLIQLLFKK
ncbi:hypothetical protein ACOI1C_06185 [Bacillus sp. DJP31]|uniref:hypothetical protein n=1 Tax=Bacillus sp. DJP31 TaxID=3409789 RepID=UPI003BB5B9D6